MKLRTSDGFQLDVSFTRPKGAKKAVIFAHGLTVDKNDEGVFVRSAKKLNEVGIATLLFDFRGHGLSSGDSTSDFTISGQLIDLETVLAFVQSQGFNSISIAGASFGGGAVALFCASHSSTFDQIALVNPVLDYDATFLHPITAWGKKYFLNYKEQFTTQGFVSVGSRQFKAGKQLFDEMEKFAPCVALRHCPAPFLVIHSDHDSYIDCTQTKACFNSVKNQDKRFETIHGAEHGFHEEPFETEVTEMIVEFLKIA